MMWFYMEGSERIGPISLDELKTLANDGTITGATMVWSQGMEGWQRASQAISDYPWSLQSQPAVPPVPPAAGAPSPYAAPGVPGAPAGAEIPNLLPWSIAATVLCCWPAGVPAIIFSSKANSAKAIGDMANAQQHAKTAKVWLGISVGFGVVVLLLAVVLGLMGELGNM